MVALGSRILEMLEGLQNGHGFKKRKRKSFFFIYIYIYIFIYLFTYLFDVAIEYISHKKIII
jgi:hypothetical protein